MLTLTVFLLLLYERVALLPLAGCCAAVCLAALLAYRRHPNKHGGLLMIDANAQRSRMNGWNAGAKLLLAVGTALLCVAADNMGVSLFVFVGMTALTLFVGRTRFSQYWAALQVPFLFIMAGCLAILIEISPTPIGVLNLSLGNAYLSVTPSGQDSALSLILKAFGAVSCLYMLSLSTPMYQIVAALRRFRVPSVIIELMYLIYRYLFILLEAHDTMTTAAASRLGYRGGVRSIQTSLLTSRNMFLISLRRASDSFTAMEARCYEGELRFYRRPQPVQPRVFLVAAGFLAGIIFFWWMGGRG